MKKSYHTINKSSWITKIGTQSTPRPKKLEDVTQSPNNSSSSLTGGSSPTSQGTNTAVGNDLPPPPGPLPPEEELLRLRVTRIMDDGEQTLGIMDILAEDEQTVLFSLATSELPYKGNQNNISCVPIDNYRVQSHTSGKHGECFWLIGNEGGGYAFNKIYGNGYTRGAILIHMSPKAPGWLHGCIGPGLKFNMQNDQKGRQKGTGQNYLNPAKSQSKAAMNKLMNVLYNVGSFKLEIVNQISPLPNNFNSSVKNIASSKNLLPNPYVA